MVNNSFASNFGDIDFNLSNSDTTNQNILEIMIRSSLHDERTQDNWQHKDSKWRKRL